MTSCFTSFSISSIRLISNLAFFLISATADAGISRLFAKASHTKISILSQMLNLFSGSQILASSGREYLGIKEDSCFLTLVRFELNGQLIEPKMMALVNQDWLY
jgi:hypothetical protein